ncbi:XRE family transcriptional regulator [Mycolicibacterium sp. Y3]
MATATFSKRLNQLFEVVYPPGRGPYCAAEVVHELRRRGHRISMPYMSQLRSGTRFRPSPRMIDVLSEFFGVHPDYLLGRDSASGTAVAQELHWLSLAHDDMVRRVVSSLLELPPGLRDQVLAGISDQQASRRVAYAG